MISKLFYTAPLAFISIYLIVLYNHKQKDYFHFEGDIFNEPTPFVFNTTMLPSNDYNRLIDIDFEFEILCTSCEPYPPFLLILIHSSAENSEKRRTIRETWGMNGDQVKTVFLLGNSTFGNVNKDVREESRQFEDIVQGSFVENYSNLSYKHGMALKYALYHCKQAKYVLRADDDIFINTPELVSFLKNSISAYGAERCLMCNLNRQAFVMRSYRSKWRISFEQYPEKYYPIYCEGWHVVYSPDVIFRLYKELQNHKYFEIDDVLVTGILVDKIKYVTHSDTASMTYVYTGSIFNFIPKWFLFGGRQLNEYERKMLWNKVHKKGGE